MIPPNYFGLQAPDGCVGINAMSMGVSSEGPFNARRLQPFGSRYPLPSSPSLLKLEPLQPSGPISLQPSSSSLTLGLQNDSLTHLGASSKRMNREPDYMAMQRFRLTSRSYGSFAPLSRSPLSHSSGLLVPLHLTPPIGPLAAPSFSFPRQAKTPFDNPRPRPQA
jgi:hypothetical protein